jgi:trehalose 6-phosphate phosphatase
MDRTLLDIAPIPDSVAVAPDLLEILLRLRAACGDSPAVVTGRPVEQINQLLGDIPYAVAGEHGGACDTHRARRSSASRCLRRRTSGWRKSPPSCRRTLMICWRISGGFVLNYRAVPERGDPLREALERLMVPDAHRLLPQAAYMAWVAKPRSTDEHTAVAQLMRRAPFAGRMPIFIRDDVTYEDGKHVARATGGAGLRVPDLFGDAVGVRPWLATAVAALPHGATA